MRTFKVLVRVLVRKNDGDGGGEGEHLELVFGEDHRDEESDERDTIRANRRYGAVPASLVG